MAALVAVTMPKFGLAMTEGMVAAWHKDEGQAVAAGEELADIETSKIANAFESPAAGVLCRRMVPEGESAPVGALIGVLATREVSAEEIDAFVREFEANYTPPEADAEGEAAGPEAQVLETPLGRLRYLAMGDTAGGAVPLLLLHGFGGDLENWMFLQPELAAGALVYALDLPGHGASVKTVGDGSPAALAAAVAAFVEGLGIERVRLVGHSLGGAVAIEFAATHPQRVESLHLIAPAGLGSPVNREYTQGFIAAKRGKQLRPVLEMLFAKPGLVGRDMIEDILRYKRLDGVADALAAIVSRCFPEGGPDIDCRALLERVEAPVQLLWGEADRVIAPLDAAPAGARLERFADAGHMLHLEQATAVARTIAG